jgi:hypothetical protein
MMYDEDDEPSIEPDHGNIDSKAWQHQTWVRSNMAAHQRKNSLSPKR